MARTPSAGSRDELSPRPASRRRTTGIAKDKKGDKGIAKKAHALQTHLQTALMREHRHLLEEAGRGAAWVGTCMQFWAKSCMQFWARSVMHFWVRSVMQFSPSCVGNFVPTWGPKFAYAINFVLNFIRNEAWRPDKCPATLVESACQL